MSVPVPTVPFRPQRSVGTASGSNSSSLPVSVPVPTDPFRPQRSVGTAPPSYLGPECGLNGAI